MTNDQIRLILQRVVVAADRYVARVEYNRSLIADGAGHLSASDEERIAETDRERLEELIAAVQAYRPLALEKA